jgi:uncharacterized membrane protein YhhN
LAVALKAVSVFETYSDVSRILSQEASALAALYRGVGGYPEPVMPTTLTIACLLATTGLVVAEFKQLSISKPLCKVAASTAFILLALSLHATDSTYGQTILVALVLSATGDVCLLSQRSALFLSGLAFFLLAHLAFSVAFACGTLQLLAGAAGLGLMSIVGALTLRWLWSHLGTVYKAAVSVYVVALVAMCSLAVSYSAASGSLLVGFGALAFAASDIAVARNRFVAPGFPNRAWGLPAYYSAQLMLAWSIAKV